LAGLTSQGKTAMAAQIAISAAKSGFRTAVFSMEMSNLEILQRAASHLSEVDSYAHQGGRMNTDERRRFHEATAELYDNLPLLLDDTTGSTVPAIAAQIAKASPRPRFVVIDYLQLMEASGRAENRTQAISQVSRGLKQLASQFQIPVLALSQLNRDSAKAGRVPDLHDLRESGSIEQDANTVLMIYGKPDQESFPVMQVDLLVKKNRGGRRGKVRMIFEKPYSRFTEE